MMIIYIMSEWHLMHTCTEGISLDQLCRNNNFISRDENEPYIYRLNKYSFLGNTINFNNMFDFNKSYTCMKLIELWKKK